MGCTPAPTCRLALTEATENWPKRDRSWDGICGDASHQTRRSDHNTGDAYDLTHDPKHGVDSYKIADWLRARVLHGDEKRVKYIISDRRIFNPSVSDNWRKYTGSNPHDHHMHVSILPGARNAMSSWWDGYQEGDDMTPEEKQRLEALEKLIAVHDRQLFTKKDRRSRVNSLDERVKKLEGKPSAH